MSKRPNIADAMREAGGSTRNQPTANPSPEHATTTFPTDPSNTRAQRVKQSSRVGTKAITGHYPPAVRYQLKLLAAEQSRTMEDLIAEGLNLLFAAYNKPEIAPAVNNSDS